MRSKTYKNGSSNPVTMGKAFRLFWTNYVKFNGTSSRSEYWWWYLWNIIIHFPLGILLLISILVATNQPSFLAIVVLLTLANGIVNLGMLLPQLSLSVRRLRDAGLSTVAICCLLIGDYVVAIVGIMFHPLWIICVAIGIYMFVMDLMPSKARYQSDTTQ